MSLSAPARWIVTYDIASPRRLGRVFRFLKKHGIPMQYSVFCIDATAAQIGALMAQLARIVHRHEDDVRAYKLPENGWRVNIGCSLLPAQMLMTEVGFADPLQP